METATTDVGNDLAFHPLQRSGRRGAKGVGPYRDSEFSILSQIFSIKFKLVTYCLTSTGLFTAINAKQFILNP